ncbi:MAG TPA: hypothetical protein PLS90_12235 [Candidatus Sumerlaeota bacterium]|nr:MAG: hypothetical protein BWZ08_00653 [candidate division BRC1 bacterium ADurb.BinA292]HOE97026.1 hypothetical protein [Candidatus Sumerlaeota bacterium]HOR28387.1 hypothetical protein [Candidatus Sumerlaeota bacterium]HPK03215.1 hypothetical protein [Candidatus Sumerlaeota bacterium]
MNRIALRYLPERNLYHLVWNEKEGTVTRASLESFGSRQITQLADRSQDRPEQWCVARLH